MKNTTPLCYLPNGKLVCYRLGEICILNDGEIEKAFPIFPSFKEHFLGRFRYLYRFLRMGIRAAIAMDNENIIISIGNMIYELNIATTSTSQGYFSGEGIRPLIFTEAKKIKDIADGIYFGGYLGNRSRRPVHVYKRMGVDQWEVVYTFTQGVINHVHAIVADPYRNCLWIYTGDYDKAAAIWKVTNNFESVEIVVCNDQKYRGCVAFALPEGLLYATDAPFIQNHLYLLRPDLKLVDLKLIDGSCIYGCKWNDKYVFSTTVEPDGINPTKLQAMFGRKRGQGIKDDFVHMYSGDINNGFYEIYKAKKDWLPYCSFQFGVIRFPYGDNNGKVLYFQPVATTKNDLRLTHLEQDKQ